MTITKLFFALFRLFRNFFLKKAEKAEKRREKAGKGGKSRRKAKKGGKRRKKAKIFTVIFFYQVISPLNLLLKSSNFLLKITTQNSKEITHSKFIEFGQSFSEYLTKFPHQSLILCENKIRSKANKSIKKN